MNNTPPEDFDKLEERVLALFELDFEAQQDRLRTLDSKSNALVSLAGGFLAAIFATSRLGITGMSVVVVVVLVATLCLLIAIILLCVFALRIRSYVGRAPGEYAKLLLDDIAPSAARERSSGFRRDLMRYWREATVSLRRVNRSKVRLVAVAQWTLVVAIALAAYATGLALVGLL